MLSPPVSIQTLVYNLQSLLDERCDWNFGWICVGDQIDLI